GSSRPITQGTSVTSPTPGSSGWVDTTRMNRTEIAGLEPDVGVDLDRDVAVRAEIPQLSVEVAAPAPCPAFGVEGGGVVPPEARVGEGESGRVLDLAGRRFPGSWDPYAELPVGVESPAPDGALGVESAGVVVADFDGGEGDTSGGVDCHWGAAVPGCSIPELPVAVCAPAPGHTFGVDSTGMAFSGGHVDELDAGGCVDLDGSRMVVARAPVSVLSVLVVAPAP